MVPDWFRPGRPHSRKPVDRSRTWAKFRAKTKSAPVAYVAVAVAVVDVEDRECWSAAAAHGEYSGIDPPSWTQRPSRHDTFFCCCH